jgi:tRNA threonylcarbamoyladenosine dehydratase
MDDYLIRTEMLIGKDAVERLSKSRVAVFGLGGVGGYVTEALARTGVGSLDLIDSDTVALSNLNRQIIATRDTVGEKKTEVMKKRVLSINPGCTIRTWDLFYLPETKDMFNFSDYDYVVDAVDTVAAKLSLIEEAQKTGTRIISSMGAGNKLDATLFRVADIYSTSVDPLARVIRTECRKRGIRKLKVVYSTEKPITPLFTEETSSRRSTPASIAFIPSVCGLIIAGEVIKDLINQ